MNNLNVNNCKASYYYLKPSSSLQCEFDMNGVAYLKPYQRNVPLDLPSSQIVREMVCNTEYPNLDKSYWSDMITFDSSGNDAPPHVPLVSDTIGDKLFELFIKWLVANGENVIPPHLRFPVEIASLLDPTTVLKLINPMLLYNYRVSMFVAGYSDCVDVGMIEVPMRQIWLNIHKINMDFPKGCTMYKVVLRPLIDVWYNPWSKILVNLRNRERDTHYSEMARIPDLCYGDKVVVWNCRGIARPSFRTNFFKIYDRYRPKLIILLEVRCSYEHCACIANELPLSRWLYHDYLNPFVGGILIMWSGTFYDFHFLNAEEGVEGLLQIAQSIHGGPSVEAPDIISEDDEEAVILSKDE